MSPRKLKIAYFHACYGKYRHPHALAAMHHALSLSRGKPQTPWHVYVCDFCAGLHVGRWKNFNRVLTEDMDTTQEGADSIVGP